jgi:carbon monoxide dehydrogenase subunit G
MGNNKMRIFVTRFFAHISVLVFALVFASLSNVANAQTITLQAALAGTNEVANGDPDGTGRALVNINTTTGAVSWNIAAFNILIPIAAAHIHQAAAGVNGGVIFDFSAQLVGSGTMTTTLAAQIAANPAGFYVNVHTSEHPGGAVRGQLTAAGLALPVNLSANLSGANEVSNGDPDGTGAASVVIDPVTGAISWNFVTANVDTPTLAHIHNAAAGVNGPVVFDFAARLSGSGVMSLALASNITSNPADFYVNIHTAPHPGGAVRGQLRASGGDFAGTNSVPTLSEWALIFMALMLAAIASKQLKRKP